MELKIKQSDFLEALRWTHGIAEKKSTMPVLSNVLLSSGGKTLSLLATDLELNIKVDVPCLSSKKGSVLVNAKGLYDIIRELPVEEIELKGNKEGLEISSGRSQFKMLIMPTNEFPAFPEEHGAASLPFAASQLIEMIDRSSFSVSTDETRYALNGVFLEKREAKSGKAMLRMVASDGHRLAYVDRDIDQKIDLNEGVIVPRKGIALVRRLAEDAPAGLALQVGKKELVIVRAPKEEGDIGVTLLVRLIEGKFPKYNQVIPKKNDRIVSVPRSVMVGALRRASIMSQDRTQAVCFSFSPGLMEIRSSSPDLGEAKEQIDIQYKGETFKIGFNAKYLLDVLTILSDEQLVMELGDELSPCVIRSEFDKGFLSLVMPMRL
jgi:DNA polymerase III subunit beta